jgi:glycosyltransferase involved in cell wall biosynthesis
MNLRMLLIGPRVQGGEGAYMAALANDPPDGVSYELCDQFHHGAQGVTCLLAREVMLNQVIHRVTIPDMGFRALRVSNGFDLVHVHAHPALLHFTSGVPVVMSEGSSSAVYLGDYLGWDSHRIAKGYSRARRIYRLLGVRDRLLALERVTRAYVFSHWARELNIRWGADGEKLEVIYPGFPTADPVDASSRDRVTFLFAGRDFERKGGFEVVEAFAQVVDELPDSRLVLAGSDPERPNPDRLIHSWVPADRRRRVLSVLADLERRGLVVRHDWIDQPRLRRELFPTADVFVMPSHAEGFGMTNAEAMSFGLPVITSTVGPASEIVAHGETGLLVRPGDVDALRDGMARLVTEPELRRRLGQAARAEFEARFTRRRFRRDLAAFYRRAVEDRAQG